MVASATPLRILPSIVTAAKFRPDEIQGIGLGRFIYGQIVTHVVLKHYRYRLQDEAG